MLSFAVAAIFFVPVRLPKELIKQVCVEMLTPHLQLSWVYATTNVKIQIDVICRLIAGFIWEGKVLANIWFFNLGYISGIKGLAFAQDLELGIYSNIPPRKLFAVQLVGVVFGTLGQVAVLNWALNHIPGICTKDAANGFRCPFRAPTSTRVWCGALWGRADSSKKARGIGRCFGFSSLALYCL